jgi:ABC-type lipopolysaccharide export system ATPase subunit
VVFPAPFGPNKPTISQTDSGQVILNNHKIDHLPMHKRAKLGLGYLPQEPSVFRKLSLQVMLWLY